MPWGIKNLAFIFPLAELSCPIGGVVLMTVDRHELGFAGWCNTRGGKGWLNPGPALLVVLFLLSLSPLQAAPGTASIVLEWDPSDAVVTDYVVYYGTRPGFYPFSLATRGATRLTVPRLKPGLTYYFSVRAVAWYGLESEYSEEIAWTIPASCTPEEVPVSVVSLGLDGVEVTFPALPGTKYQVESSPDGKTWLPLWTSPIAPDTGSTTFRFVDSRLVDGLFYRAQMIGRYAPSAHPLTVVPNPGSGKRVAFVGSFGSRYELQSSENESDENWQSIWSGRSDETQEVKVEDPRPDDGGTRRYRLMASADPAGPYWNPCGDATNEPPTLTMAPTQQTYLDSWWGDTFPFLVDDPDTPLSVLQFSGRSSVPEILSDDNIKFTGLGNARGVVVTPARGASGHTLVTLTVSDGDNQQEVSFDLEVLPYVAGSLSPVIRTYGSGSIRPDLDGRELIPGKRYTLTAVPGPGQAFAGWRGAFTNMSRKVTFVMRPEMLIEAYFVPSPFPVCQGTYRGLFGPPDGAVSALGSAIVTVTEAGSYSGSLLVRGRKQSFSGQLALDRSTTNTFTLPGGNPLRFEFTCGASSTEPLLGRVTDATFDSNLLAYRSTYDAKTNPAPLLGDYTLILPGQSDASLGPEGAGVASMKVSSAGVISFSGTLSDGTKVTQSTAIAEDGSWPVSIPLRSGQGVLHGWLNFNVPDANSNRVSGMLHWLNLADAKRKLYSNGFTNVLEVFAARYERPATDGRILSLEDTSITFAGGDLAETFSNAIALGEKNRVENLSANKLSLRFNLANGLFQGSVVEPATGKSRRFIGGVLQNRDIGWGHLLGTNHSARVTLGF